MGYHGWEPECDYEFECENCTKHENTIQNLTEEATNTGEMFTSILKMLYSKEKINMSQLEKEIDNLCYHLDIPTIEGDLQIQQKRLPSFLNNLLELNYA